MLDTSIEESALKNTIIFEKIMQRNNLSLLKLTFEKLFLMVFLEILFKRVRYT